MACNTGDLGPVAQGPAGTGGCRTMPPANPRSALLDGHTLALHRAALTAAQPLPGRFISAQSSNTKDQTRRRPFMVPPWTAALSVLEIR